MARPRKAEDEKLVPVSTSLPKNEAEALERLAEQRRVPLAMLLRALLSSRFRNLKTTEQISSLTL
jgi:hypothetical protein